MTARTQNPYAAPGSEVTDDARDPPVLSRTGRALLWLAFSGNLLMVAASIFPRFAVASDWDISWANVLPISLAALSIASLFQRTATALFWLSAVVNSMLAVVVAVNVIALISLGDRVPADAAPHAQAAIVALSPIGLLCLLTVVTLVVNRGRS
jgi:hypothetical protein